MKKVFLSLTMIAALALTSCKETPKEDVEGQAQTETTVSTDEKIEATTETSTIGTPSFSDSDVQAYVDSYESYMADYKKAVESNDMTAFSSLSIKGQKLAAKLQELDGTISDDDAEKLTAYISEKTEELQELSKKMMQ